MRTSDLVASFRDSFRRLAGAGLLSFFLAVKPVPASRPRVSKWGTYYAKTYETFRKDATVALNSFDGVPTDRPVIVWIEVVVEKPKTGKLLLPKGDVDNYAKGPLDVFTKAQKFWADDDQVVGLSVFKRYAQPGEQQGFHVMWAPVDLTN